MEEPDKKFLRTVKKLLLTSSKTAKDECDDVCVYGKKGKLYVDSAFWYIYIPGARRWNHAKKVLDFLKVWQDGDSEGVLRADYPISSKQATLVRNVLGLRKKKVLSQKQKDMLKKHAYRPAITL